MFKPPTNNKPPFTFYFELEMLHPHAPIRTGRHECFDVKFVELILSGASMQGLLRDERSARIFNSVMALALAASVMMIFW
jgi:hypothetical protein